VGESRDPYEVLQVASSADDTVLRAAYRALAHRYHPDVAGPDGELRMRELNAAWEIVRDPERRAAYDRSRMASGTRGSAGVREGTNPPARQGSDPGSATRPAPPPSAPPWTGAAGPPPGHPSGSVLDFGVFYGWSLGEIARHDAGYLEWLEKKPEGRKYAAEIDALLRRLGMRGTRTADAPAARARGRATFGR
jgi:curved DNA-binding protein CbpA